MKKYIFSAIACVAFAGSSMASNGIDVSRNDVNIMSIDTPNSFELNETITSKSNDLSNFSDPKRPCTVYVTIINRDGSTGSLKGEGGELTWSACGDYQKKYLLGLQEQNIKFTDDDVKVIWG